jgi:hypothetical protein
MTRRSALAVLALFSVFASAAPASAGGYGPRQFYSAWRRAPRRGFFYRIHSFRPRATVAVYSHHYVIYHPNRPRYFYYYNPVQRRYWGRCEIGQAGEGRYSLLAECDRRENLADIPESAFPPPGPMPFIPGADELRLEFPPADLPSAEALP